MTKFDFCNRRNGCHVIEFQISKISRRPFSWAVFDGESPGDLHSCSIFSRSCTRRCSAREAHEAATPVRGQAGYDR